ncbi:MAG: ArnT family glycosyltransferase [Sandaracinaceae bacterium]
MTSSTERAARIRVAAVAAGAGMLLGVLCWVGADRYTAHGWSATWYQFVDGEREEITRTTEHRVSFPNVHRPLARIVQGWPHERLAIPTTLPVIDVMLRAVITVPESGPRHLAVESDGTPEVFVDGSPLTDAPLSSGRHRVRIHWRSRPGPHPRRGPRQHGPTHFTLLWGTGTPVSAVPASALVPARGRWPGSRVATAWGMGLGTLLFAAWLFFALRPLGSEVRRRRLAALLTGALVLLGTGYRAFDYDVMPEFRENADELFATWNGWSLLEDGTTRGWSLWAGSYGTRVRHQTIEFFGERRNVIEPYFEHPPLLHLLVGAAAHAGGAEHWSHARLRHTRLVPIALSALAMVLLVLVGRRLSPRGPAPYLAGLLYGAMPTIALQTRVIKEEALVVVLGLGMIWFFLRWRDDGKQTRDLVLAAVCAGLAPLAKVPAVVWIPALVMLVAAERGERRRAWIAAGVAFATASLLLVYAAAIDWNVFLFTQARQAGRWSHFNIFTRFFDTPLINHNAVGRGFSLFLWVASAAHLFGRGRRDAAVLGVPLVTYLAAIGVGSASWTYGWYMVPVYPLLCLGAGGFLATLFRRPTLLAGFLFVVLLVMYSLTLAFSPDWFRHADHHGLVRRAVMLTVGLMLAPYALVQVWKDHLGLRRLAQVTTAVGLLAFTAVSARFVMQYDRTYEAYEDFDRDTGFHD